LGMCYQAFMAYDVATKDLKSADTNLEKMRQNYLLKKQFILIAEGYGVYIKIMKKYSYKAELIAEKEEQFGLILKDLGVRDRYDEFINNTN